MRAPSVCLATNYCLFNESLHRMWTELAQQLEKCNVRLVLLSTAVADPPLPFPVIHIPFLLRDYANQFPATGLEGGTFSSRDWELAQADSARSQGGYSPAEALPGLLACRHIMRTLLKTLQPGCVLTWDATSPLAGILHGLCHETGLPVQGIERGLLPETLMIESRSMQGYSDVRTHWLAQDDFTHDAAAYECLRNFYLERKPQKYNQPAFAGGGKQLREELKLGDRKALVFLGQYDGSGMLPVDSLQRRYHSPTFRSTEDVLMSLSAIVKDTPENALVFKPHPIDKNPYTAAKEQGVQIVQDVNVHALIDLADVVVAQFTTLQYEAALYDKPIVLAARGAWWGRNATYEADRREDLAPALFAALERKDWPARSTNAHAFLTGMMDRWLIGCSAEIPARRNLSHLAKFLAQTSLDADCSLTVEQRLLAVDEKFRNWRGNNIPAPQPPREAPIASQRRAQELFSKGKVAAPTTRQEVDTQAVATLRDKAELMARLGKWHEAGEHYRALALVLPDDLTVWQGRLECARQQGQKVMVTLLRGDALRAHPEWAKLLADNNAKPTSSTSQKSVARAA